MNVTTRFLCPLLIAMIALASMTMPVLASGNEEENEASATAVEGQSGSSPAEDQTVVVFDGRVLGDAQSSRLILDLDKSMEVVVWHISEPDRIVIEGPRMVFNLPEDGALEPRGIISDIRFGTISDSKSRLVVSLSEPALVKAEELVERDQSGRYRLILDFGSATQAEFGARVSADRVKYGASGAAAKKGDRVQPKIKQAGRFSVVIDPGHGGIDGGAQGVNGTIEKEVTLEVSSQIAESIRAAGPFDVYMTRDGDDFVSLKERVAFAQRKKADLFISVHADSLRQRSVRGATIYTLSRKASDALAARVAESENRVDLVAGLAVPEEQDVVMDILAELTTRETMRFAHGMSNILVNTMGDRIRLINNPQRSAAFGVLKAPEIPGVLLELGYLSNPEDEKLMNSPEWRAKVVRAITEATSRFFEPRM